jgi:hypothetical protein
MNLQKVLTCVLLVVLLGVGIVSAASAQAPENAPIPVPAGLKAELVSAPTTASVYVLPENTAYKDVIAQFSTDMTAAGWKAEAPAPDCPTGINAGAWSKDEDSLAGFILPTEAGSPPLLLTVLMGTAAASEPITVPVGLTAELVPMPITAGVYLLPAGTTAQDALAQYNTDITAAGWQPETLAADCATGINGAMWSKQPDRFMVLVLPPDQPDGQPALMTMFMTAPGQAAAPAGGPAQAGAPAGCPCCTELPAGKGGIWFENFIGEKLIEDIGAVKVDIPAKQGDAAGCAFAVLDPGKYHLIGKTESAKAGGEADVDVVAGQIVHFPIAIQGY